MVCTECELAEVDNPHADQATTAGLDVSPSSGENVTDRHSALRERTEKADSTRGESTTVDIGDCQHADSNQRQLVADAVLGGRRHGQKSSRGSGRTLIRQMRPVARVLAGEQPGDDNQHQQRDERQRDPRSWHYCPSFVVVEAAVVDSASRAARASRPSRRRTTARRRSNTRANRNAVGTMTSSTTIDCGTNGNPVIHSSTPSHHRAKGSTPAV